MLLFVFEWLVLLISAGLIVNSVNKIIKIKHSKYIIHLIFCLIFVLPILMDHVVGMPDYYSSAVASRCWGFIISYNDGTTRFLYALYILISQIIIIRFGSKDGIKVQPNPVQNEIIYQFLSYKNYLRVKIFLLLLSFASILLVLAFPMTKSILWTFGWREIEIAIEGQKYYSTVEKMSYISIASALMFLSSLKTNLFMKMILIVSIYSSVCIESKRSIIIFIMAIICVFFLYKLNRKQIIKYVLYVGLIFLFIVGMSVYVKTSFRGYESIDSIYTTLRIDYFRDDTVKMVIYSMVNNDAISLLDYPGQSIITQFGSLFPLSFLGVPVVGYNAYLTNAMMGYNIVDPTVNWMTTSLFDESLANFGLYGFWIAPMICVMMSRIADKQYLLRPITISAVLLLIMYSPNYIMWYLQFWGAIVLIDRRIYVQNGREVS